MYELNDCINCGRQITGRETQCRYCGADQTVAAAVEPGALRNVNGEPDDAPADCGDILIHGSLTEWDEWKVVETWSSPARGNVVECRHVDTGEIRMFSADKATESGWAKLTADEYRSAGRQQ